MVEVLQIETPTLGDRSYLAHDGDVAVVIDPQRDIDRVTALAERHSVRITHVAETHIHNDYVTGGLALSREVGAAYLVGATDPVSFRREPVRDGDAVLIGRAMRLRALATPGHTFNHLSYVLEAGGQVAGVFTGGSLLFGSTGRPDLLGPASTPALARAQHASARRLARELPDSAEIFPTHGFGSFCAATQALSTASTIGREKHVNPALTLDEQAYVEALLAGLDAYPSYYAHMGPANLAGPGGADLSPPRPAGAAEIRRRIESGEWVVDLRDRVAFCAGFVPGSVSFPVDGSFATYLGWALPWGTPVTLLGQSPEQVARAQRELARIGIDRLAAADGGRPEQWSDGLPLARLRRATFGDLAAAAGPGGARGDGEASRGGGPRGTDPPGGTGGTDGEAGTDRQLVVLDVRRRLEWADGHVAGAIHIPFSELPARAGELPPGEVWVYCQSGYRATVAASILAARGRRVVSVDEDFGHAGPAGLRLESAGPPQQR
jgi:hydroxyacylglutathione hydrolase